ncbi:extracellular solute-binding protein [Paenibacillus senegalensis]|uniref:extracellular solute-binding protein n=1 Tax=Paenibacillus senegalensis TaxID=1465766 RepID=UPI000289A292|nr:extracellular solute-binding protein [Paenibacillus senegalensis]
MPNSRILFDRRWSILLPLLLAAGLVLPGCTGIAFPTSSQTLEHGWDESPEKLKLTLWHNWTGQDLNAITMRKQLDKFREEHPEIELLVEGIDQDAYRHRLKTMAAVDELPDVFVMWPDWMTREFVHGGLIQPIEEALARDPFWTDRFIPQASQAFTVDGRLYSLPMSLAPSSILFYNEQLLDQYNIPVPETWEGLLQAIEVLNRHGVIPIAMGNKTNWTAQSGLFSALADRWTGSEWLLQAAEQSGSRFTDPIFLEALELMQELVRKDAFQANFQQLDSTQMRQLYIDKKAAMFIDGAWAVGHLLSDAPDEILDSTRLALMPSIPGGKGSPSSIPAMVGTGLGISSRLHGEQLEAAYQLLYALSGPDAQQAIFQSNTLVSYKLDLNKEAPRLFRELHQLTENSELAPAYESVLTSAALDVLNEGIRELLNGGEAEEIAYNIQAAQVLSLGKFR